MRSPSSRLTPRSTLSFSVIRAVGSLPSVFLISVDSARPDGTKTWTLRISALRSFLISVSVSVCPASAMTSPVSGRRRRRRAARRCGRSPRSMASDFVAQVDRHVRREHLDLVDALTAKAVEHLFGELVAFLDEHLVLERAHARRAAFFVLAFGRVGGRALRPAASMSSAMIAPMTSRDVGAALALAREVELADAEEEAEDVGVRPVPERAQQRGRRELLLLVDVDVDHVVDVDGELDPRAAERDDARRDQALSVRVRRLLEDHARRPVQLADDDALGAVDDEGAELGEQRQLTEIDLLLDDVARPLDAVRPPR